MTDKQNGKPLRVLLMNGSLEGVRIAVCLEHYIVAQGSSDKDVIREFKAMLAGEIIYGIEHGDARQPLAGVGPAPHKYWELLRGATPHDPPSMPVEIRIEPVPDTDSEPVLEIPHPEVRFRLAA